MVILRIKTVTYLSELPEHLVLLRRRLSLDNTRLEGMLIFFVKYLIY